MVQDVRSSTTGVVFDLLTQDGVAKALAFVRACDTSPEKKRELRDLIFSYTNAGGDQALRTQIESELQTLVSKESQSAMSAPVTAVSNAIPAMTNLPVEKKVTVATATNEVHFNRLGVTRSTPSFRTPEIVTKADVVPVSLASVVNTPAAKTVVATEPTIPVKAEPVPVNLPIAPVSEVIETPVALTPEVVSASVDVSNIQSTPTNPVLKAESAVPYPDDESLNVYRARISEIKQVVNSRVGNPVNLGGIDDNVKREYMTSLLEAMKAVSGGSGDIASAMSRLEKVFIDVQNLLDSQTTDTSSVSSDSSTTKTINESVDTSMVAEVTASTASVIEPVVPSGVDSSRIPVNNVDKIEISPVEIAPSRFKNVLPVNEQPALKTPADLPTAAEVKAMAGITDPLQDPDVDSGLDQLLGEWSLFKKSGVFGTGPKGRQHPLFLKLAVIPMPLILSGRYEGSTNEIRQSITDYMNGWRYEQGVVYNQDETFEHYLRRVIRHIIDSQTRRRTA